MSSFRVTLRVFAAIHLASMAHGNVVGCYHCTVQSTCSLVYKGQTGSAADCYNSYCDSDCSGIQFNADAYDCYKLKVQTACDPFEYTSANIYLYKDQSRTDCSLLTLSSFHGYGYGPRDVNFTVEPSTYGECVQECFNRPGCLDFVYKPTTCFIFDDCSTCDGPFFYDNDYTLYRFACIAATTGGTPAQSPAIGGTPAQTPATGLSPAQSSTNEGTPAQSPVTGGTPAQSPATVASTSAAVSTTTSQAPLTSALAVPTTTDSQIADCRMPDAIWNGIVGYSSTTEGSTATYYCDPGFSLNGDETRVCEENGHWSNSAPICESDSKATTGTNAHSPANGGTPTHAPVSSGASVLTTATTGTAAQPAATPWTTAQNTITALTTVTSGTTVLTTATSGTVAQTTTTAWTTALKTASSDTVAQTTATSGSTAKSPATLGTTAQTTATSVTTAQSPATSMSTAQATATSVTIAQTTATAETPGQSPATSGTPAQPSSSPLTPTVLLTTGRVLTAQATTSGASTTLRSTTSITAKSSTAPSTKPIYIWPCLCSNNLFLGKTQEEIIEELVNDIKIDKSSTLLASSKLQCMSDLRSTARNIGIVGIALLSVVGGVMLMLDCLRMLACPCCGRTKH